MKHGKFAIICGILALLCGCGHNVYLEREMTGVGVIIPVGDSALGVSIGSVKTVSATMRGGASIETTTSTGGGIFSGSGAEARVTNFKTNMQLNEANLREVMISPEVPETVKVVLATNLASAAKAPKFMPAILQTDTATVHMGSEAIQSNAVPQVVYHPKGVDKVVDTIPSITTPIVQTVTDLTDSTIGNINATIDKTIDRAFDWAIVTKWMAIIGMIVTVITLLIKKSGEDSKTSSSGSAKVGSAKKTPVKETPTNKQEPMKSPSNDPIIEEIKPLPDEPKKNWFQKIIAFISGAIALIGKIPPEQREKIVKMFKDWVAAKRAERAKKKQTK